MFYRLYNSDKILKYSLLTYSLIIIVLSGMNIKTSPHGFVAKDKILHIVEYSILGFLSLRYLELKGKKFKKSFILTLFLGTIFAVSDEIHQGFVGFFSTGIFGAVRDPDVFDVFADVAGLLLAAAAYFFINNKIIWKCK